MTPNDKTSLMMLAWLFFFFFLSTSDQVFDTVITINDKMNQLAYANVNVNAYGNVSIPYNNKYWCIGAIKNVLEASALV